MKVFFVTTNQFKIDELEAYLAARRLGDRLMVSMFRYPLQEILHSDIERIVRQKTIEAYEQIRCPCIVEHSGLFMDALPGLPGGVGRIVWDAIGERMCGFLSPTDPRNAVARSLLGYCDGRRVRIYTGETRGHVADRARGSYAFSWDPVFIPEGSQETYGEMGPQRKQLTSPGAKAWAEFIDKEVLRPPHR